jgi:hypothetical protein
MNADDMEPSANSSLRRLGIRKATKKTSDFAEAPKYDARIMSFTYPRIRLISVAADISPAARAILPLELIIRPSRNQFHPDYFTLICPYSDDPFPSGQRKKRRLQAASLGTTC